MTPPSDEELRSQCPVLREVRARPRESALRQRTTQIRVPSGRGVTQLANAYQLRLSVGWRLV